MIAEADSMILSESGPTLFHRFIHREDHPSSRVLDWNVLDIAGQKWIKEGFPERLPYCVLYIFKITGKPWIHEPIAFYFDANGNLLSDMKLEPIPICRSYPDSCTFRIDSITAVEIAKEVGFEKGFGRWKVIFKWNGGGEYVWSITNVLTASGDKGKNIVIDANSGAVLHTYAWQIEY